MNVRRSIAAAAVLITAPVLSSCGVNFNEQTDQVYNPAVGTDDRSGTVDVLNALVVSGTDGSGTVVATLVNKDQRHGDALSGVTGAGADSKATVQLGGATKIPAAGLLNLATDGRVFLRGSRVAAGNFVKITFSFGRAQSITLDVPVVSASSPNYAGVRLPSGA